MHSQTLCYAHQCQAQCPSTLRAAPQRGEIPPVRRLLSEGCDLRRPINTAKAKVAWVMVPMGSSSRYMKSAGSPLAPPTPTGPRGPSSSHHNQPGALQLIAKWQNPKTNILIALLGWDVPHSTVQACGRHRDMFLPVQPGQCSKGARDTGRTMRDHSRPCSSHGPAEGGLWPSHSPS